MEPQKPRRSWFGATHLQIPGLFHLRKILNAHIDDAGWVAHFPVEVCNLEVAEKGVIAGLNSFGRSEAAVWGRKLRLRGHQQPW